MCFQKREPVFWLKCEPVFIATREKELIAKEYIVTHAHLNFALLTDFTLQYINNKTFLTVVPRCLKLQL